MCGIGGQLRSRPVEFFDLQSWRRDLERRGPDAWGTFRDDQLQLIHTRLSVIDLDERSNQPMSLDRDGCQAVLAFNGEIYNYREIRQKLETMGAQFATEGDAEVLLKAYAHYGLDFVEHLNGMFAIALWDLQLRKLFLIRDRLGIKPLFFAKTDESFYFCSSMGPLVSSLKSCLWHDEALRCALKFRYNFHQETVIKGVFHLPAGKILEVDESLKWKELTYWQFPVERPETLHSSKASIQEEFYETLRDAVRLRTRADVPIGTFLSGGIDSSAVTALAHEFQPEITALTMRMDRDSDETPLAKELCQQLQISHREVETTQEDHALYPEVFAAFDEPFGDSIALPTWKLCRQMAREAKVVLTGEGADEVLGGYVHHFVMAQTQLFHQLFPWVSLQKLSRLIQFLPVEFLEKFFPYPGKLGKEGVRRLTNYLDYFHSPAQAYARLVSLIPENEQGATIEEAAEGSFGGRRKSETELIDFWNSLSEKDFVNRLLTFDLRFWNTFYTLTRLDRMSMAHSLEARVPFLDHRLVELSLSVSGQEKLNWRESKQLLRKSLKSHPKLSSSLLRRKKRPFVLDVEKTFSSGFQKHMRDEIHHQEPLFKQLVDKKSFEMALAEKNGGIGSSKRTFSFYAMAEYLKNHPRLKF